jgi:nicotinate-nucleotide adenylyltransferase
MVRGPETSPDTPLRIGLFGGTFDPPHRGHVSVASDVADALGLDRVLWIPAGDPPHKSGADMTPAPLRLEMVRAATRPHDRFAVSAAEIRREGPSYTVDTLRDIRAAHPDADLFLIVGTDQFAAFGSWRDPEEILSVATLAVMNRGGVEASERAPSVPGVEDACFVPVTRVDLSSSEVRARIHAGEGSLDGDVPPAVADFIAEQGLYRG